MPTEIETLLAEDKVLKAQGLHHRTKRRADICAALKVLGYVAPKRKRGPRKPKVEAPEPVQPSVATGTACSECPTLDVSATSGGCGYVPEYTVATETSSSFPGFGDYVVSTPSPTDTPEWRFIEKCCAELDVNLGKGITTDLAKRIYDRVVAKVMAWRMLLEIVTENEPGADFPPFSKLGRNTSTGKKQDQFASRGAAVQERAKEQEAKASAPKDPIPVVTAGGMPMRGRPSPQEVMANMGGPDVADHAAAIKNQVAAMVGARPEPARAGPD